jgi:hypothetical protein
MGRVAAETGADRVRGMEALVSDDNDDDAPPSLDDEGGPPPVNLFRERVLLLLLLLLILGESHEGTGGLGRPGDTASFLLGC